MTFDDREYQQQAIEKIVAEWARGVRVTMIECATGTGKTVIFARIIQGRHPKRSIVLAHRNELIIQAKEKIEALTGLDVDVEKAELYASTHFMHRRPVVVSSIQTLISGPRENRRYMRFKPEDFDTIVLDECHHSTAASWREILDWFLKNPDAKALGVTATADRADGEALGQIFETCCFKYGILDGIKDGYLVPITQQFVPVPTLDYSNIHTVKGDLDSADLSRVMEAEENIYGICQPTIEAMYGLKPKTLHSVPVPEWRDYLRGLGRDPRRTIVFTVSVPQAEACANVFLRAMDDVEWVSGETSKDKRAQILKRFKNGDTHCVINCMVLTEGYDNPFVELIVMARPTKSRSLYTQMVGRSTRTLPGIVDEIPVAEIRREMIEQSRKPFCRILDFVGNSGRHKLITCMDILGGNVSEAATERAIKNAIKDGKPKMVLAALSNAEIELEREKQAAMERARLERAARKSHLLARADYQLKDVSPFDHTGEKVTTARIWSRDGREFSPRQLKIFREAGYDASQFEYRQGQAIIGKLLKNPTEKMIKALVKFGFDPVGEKWDRNRCQKELRILEKNKWCRQPQPT
jgi:superfamily II DNA or RNA helicase